MARLWIWVVWLAACSPADAPPPEGSGPTGPPSLLLVTLDTTRADRIGAYGHAEADTPVLDRLAAEGVLFESALAVAPGTLPSHTSILTGVIPPVHGVRDNGIFVLGQEATLVSEVLQREGWRTGAFVGSYVLDPRFGLDQGFEVYRAPARSTAAGTSHVERPADEVVDDAVAWLSTLEPDERFFVWLHFYDPHAPHAALEPWASAHDDLYDAEIAFCDAQLGRLLRFLESRGQGEKLLVAVTADHGESFGEHGEDTHGAFIYDATLRVPLILSGPPVAEHAGRVVRTRVSNLALPATLFELAGIPRERMAAMSSPALPGLGPDLEAGPEGDRPLYIESYYPYHSFRWHAYRGLVWRDRKLIEGKQPELYELAADPGERRDRADEQPEEVERMRARLEQVLEAEAPLGWAGESRLDPGEQAALEALGYLEASTGGNPFDPTLPDARDRIGDIDRLERAAELAAEAHVMLQNAPPAAWQRREHTERARALQIEGRDLLARVNEENPDDPISLHRLAVAEVSLENYTEAVGMLEKVVSVRPSSSAAHYNLGRAYLGAGRKADGVRSLEHAIELEPEQPRYHLQLAIHYQMEGDLDRCAERLERLTAVIAPSDPSAPAVQAFVARVELERDRAKAAGANP